MKKLTLFLLSFLITGLQLLQAQGVQITGKVTSAETGQPLPGVSIVVKGTTVGTTSGVDGTYKLTVPADAKLLMFSFVGLKTIEMSIEGKTTLDVQLAEEAQALSEIVVTGYTSQRKKDITGAVSTVDNSELTAIPAGIVTNQLQGLSSGVTVVGDGQPGDVSRVRIRGFSSFQNNDPLYVVDGVPTQDISSIDPNDVASMSVLKDAGAASVYGSRASNGVIIITTKKGTKGTRVTFDMYSGIQDPGKGPTNLLNTQEYANLQWLVYKNDGTVENNPLYGPSSNATPTLPAWAANTNWYKQITRTAPIQNYDLTLSGGSDKANYFAGIGYFDQQGIIIDNYAKRASIRFNSDYTFLNDHVKIGENFTGAYRPSLGVANLSESSPIQMGPYRAQSIVPAVITDTTGMWVYNSSHTFVRGDYGGTGIAPRLGNNTNEYANLQRSGDNSNWNVHIIGNAYLDVMILKGLNFRSTAGGTWDNGYNVTWNGASYENAENNATPSLNEYSYFGSDWVWTNTLTFDRTFGQHKINAVVGYEAIAYGMGRDVSATRAGYFSTAPDFRTLTNGATITAATSDYYTPTSLESQFVKADYSFMDRYLLSATVRRDGSSRFGASDQYGVFPSVSAGWRINSESFMQGIDWINDLKIRGSYGTMGNQLAVSPQNQFTLFGGDASTSNYDLNGSGTSSLQGWRPTQIGNPNAKWETNTTTNIGFESQLFNSKLGLVFDYYTKDTKDLLYNPQLPGTAGDASPPYINVASMTNHGLDIELRYRNTFGDLGFAATVTYTSYNNKITKVANNGVNFFDYGSSRIGSFSRNEVGEPVSAFFGYKVVGIFKNAAQVSAAAEQDGAQPGFFQFANLDTKDVDTAAGPNKGRQVIDPNDRTIIGNPNPKFTGGVNLAFTYKNFDLSAFLYVCYGNDIFNWNKWWTDFWPSFQGQKSTQLLYDSWTPSNPNATVPMASNTSNFSTNTQSCSYYIEKGSYARLKTLQIGYTFPKSSISKLHISNLRIYVQATNLFTITKYSGLDPELGGSDLNFGTDYGNYPNVKTYLFGINLGL